MTRSQLIAHVAAATGMTEAVVENVMDSVFDTIVEKLQQGEKVTIAGFKASGRLKERLSK